MEKIIESKYIDPVTEIETIMITIDRGNGEYTSMTKEHWDKLEAAKEAQSL